MTTNETTLNARPPDLRILHVENLAPHEREDAQRADPLVRRLPIDGTLMNPPVVTPLESDPERFMLLDGTNRALAFQQLGYRDILAQVVEYKPPYVELYTWNHVLSDLDARQLQSRLDQLTAIEHKPTTLLHARAKLARRAVLAYYILPDSTVMTLGGGGLDLRKRTEIQCAIVDTYLNQGRLNRTNLDDPNQLLRLYPDMSAAMIFPHYEMVEVLDLAESGLRIPPGVTRHLIHGRALRLHYPLEKLTSDTPLDEKNQELQTWLQAKAERREVRYYAEATYMYDE